MTLVLIAEGGGTFQDFAKNRPTYSLAFKHLETSIRKRKPVG